MRLWLEIARLGFRRYAAYRGATWAGVFTNTVFGFLRAYVFIALFAAAGSRVGGFDLTDTLTYTFVTQGMLMTVFLWGWWDVALSVRSGDVVTDLFRPFDYQGYWLAQDLGRAVYHAVARGIPPFLLGALVFDLRLPQRPETWFLFAASVALAVWVSFGIRFLTNLSAFWLLDHRGPGNVLAAVWTFAGGFIVPVAFFPDGVREAARLLPFAGTIQTPVEVFLEKHDATGLVAALGLQVLWGSGLHVVGRRLLARATRRVVVQGG